MCSLVLRSNNATTLDTSAALTVLSRSRKTRTDFVNIRNTASRTRLLYMVVNSCPISKHVWIIFSLKIIARQQSVT